MIKSINAEIELIEALIYEDRSQQRFTEFFSVSNVFPEFYKLEIFLYFKRIDIFRQFDLFSEFHKQNFFKWIIEYGLYEFHLEYLIDTYKQLKQDNTNSHINTICDYSNISGISTSAKQLCKVLERSGVELRNYDVQNLANFEKEKLNKKSFQVSNKSLKLESKYNFFINNGDQMQNIYHHISGKDPKSINIGYWAWELERLHDSWMPGFDYIDEIWTVSNFCAQTFKKYTKKRVQIVPIAITKELLKIENYIENQKLTVLFQSQKKYITSIIDFRSCIVRKNLIGTLKFFSKFSFINQDNIYLVLKILNFPSLVEIRNMIETYVPNHSHKIIIIQDNLSAEDLNALIKNSIALVSLHRSEGFGIPLAIAMGLGTPVLATGFSGNLDFMNEDNSFLVQYDLVEVSSDSAKIYQVNGAKWAQPNLSSALDQLNKIIGDEKLTIKKINHAKSYIFEKLSLDNIYKNIILD
jgi:glycosyltransferase involved in cell wall biosynthesis